jgi:hypothetical protein
MNNCDCSDIPLLSLRKRIFKLLDKNPLLTPKALCTLTNENHQKRGEVVRQYKKQWKCEYQKQHGSIRSIPDGVHNVFFKGKLPLDVTDRVRKELREVWERAGWNRWVFPSAPMRQDGWRNTNAKNRFLLFKSFLGRIRLFENGTVEMFVKKPASEGKALQLFCEAFTKTYLIDSIKIVEEFRKTLMRRMHVTFDTGERLPYIKVTAFEETHKLSMVLGDKTHPSCAEFMVEYHAEVELAKKFMEQLKGFFGEGLERGNGVKPIGKDYSV